MTKVANLSLEKKQTNPFATRIHEIDFIRGILILLVLFDHSMWLAKHYVFLDQNGFMNWYWTSSLREIVRQICLLMFCFLSGISASFSRQYRKRALLMLGLWFVILTGSRGISNLNILNQKTIIDFNIIGVLAFSMLIYSFVQYRSTKIKVALVIFSFLMWWNIVPLISSCFAPNDFFFPLWCGDGETVSTSIYGWKTYYADYLPLFPYMMAFFLGTIFSFYFYKNKVSLCRRKKEWERPFCFVGRHTLVIYLTHQAVLIPLFVLINFLIYQH